MPKTVRVVDYADILGVVETSAEWRRFYPRIYDNVGAYNPKVLAAGLLCTALNASTNREKATDFEAIHYPVVCLLMRHGIPQYFVGKELAVSLVKTDIPDDVELTGLAWPFPAVAFQLPRGVLVHRDEGALDTIMVSIVRPGRYHLPGYAAIDAMSAGEANLVVSTFMRESANFISYWASVPLNRFTTFGEAYNFLRTGTFKASSFGLDSVTTTTVQLDQAVNEAVELNPVVVDDASFNLEMFRLGLNLLLTLEHEPALIEPALRFKVVKAKKPGLPPKEFWHPNYLGRHYRVPRPWQGGTHASPRIHWRRGHWRAVRTGSMALPLAQRPTVKRRIPATLVKASNEVLAKTLCKSVNE